MKNNTQDIFIFTFIVDKNEHNLEHSKPNSNERIIIGGESDSKLTQNNHVSHDLLLKFEGKSREVRLFIFYQYIIIADNINFCKKTSRPPVR